MRLAVQAIYFVFIARSLGPSGYGAFVGVVALVAIMAPFASWGTGNLLVKHVSRDPSTFGAQWGRALVMTALTGTLLLGVALAASRLLLPRSIPVSMVAMVGLADLIGTRLVEVVSQAYQAFDRLSRTMVVLVGWSVAKLLAVVALLGSPLPQTPVVWAAFYAMSTWVATIFAVILATVELGRPRFPGRLLWMELREGAYFATSLAAQNVYNDIDKTLLARLSTLTATGIYGAAYRIVDVAFVPVRSVLFATYARFFRHGELGLDASRRFMMRILPFAALYAGVAALGLAVTAPFLQLILGPGYRDLAPALRWLALLPLLKSLHYFPADALTGAGHQGSRAAAQVGVALWNVALCFALIPRFGWLGAAWASLASDGALAGALWLLMWWHTRAPRDVGEQHDQLATPVR